MRQNRWKTAILSFSILFFMSGCYNGLRIGIKPVDVDDDIPPYIYVNTYEFTTTLGKPIDFSNITAYDDVDGLCSVEVVGTVNYNKAGEYYPTLVSRDTSSNVTEVEIYVVVLDVVDETEAPVTDTPETTAEPEAETGCSGGKDPELPCDYVVPQDLEGWQKLYYGKEGLDQCMDGIDPEAYACEAIYANDGSFWGYGLKRREE